MIGLIALLTLPSASFFPFVIPWDDAVKGTATDVSGLTKPEGWIVARDGHFYAEKSGERMRFLGVNFTTRAAFPTHEDADKVAARLAKLGINIVRFHHMQNSWDPKGTIWKPDKMMLELDPKSLDRLDYLLAALKKRGIYANLNLQTTRDYLPEMGFPESVKHLPWGFAKRVDKFDPKMIALQKQYAKDLLDRTNPYTGLKYKDDPEIAVIEINNENSLVGEPWATLGGDLERVPEPFRGELVGLWNRWLSKKYPDQKAMTAAWGRTKTARGPNLIAPGAPWTFESHDDAKMTGSGASTGFTAQIERADGTDWHVQANMTGLDVHDGDTYTVKFTASADRDRTVLLHAGLEQGDYHNIGLTASIHLTTTPRAFSFTFKAADTTPNHTRVGFFMGQAAGEVKISDFSISPGTDPFVLPAGQSLAQGNIDLPTGAPEAEQADFIDFLTETEAAYSLGMRNYLRNELGFRNLIMDSQIAWGGLTSLVREAPMDFADNHSYYHHPSFPGGDWSETNWTIQSDPMTSHLSTDNYGELTGLAQTRVAGKPYTISEYNHPAPQDGQAEMMPLVSTFGAIQDWDIVYCFDYGTYGEGEPNDRIQGFFGVGSNPAKAAFFPAAALIFRQGLLPSATADWLLKLPEKPYATALTAGQAWSQAGGLPDLLGTRVAIEPARVSRPEVVKSGVAKRLADVRVMDGKNVYVVEADRVQVAVGYVGNQTVMLGDSAFTFGGFGNGFASMTLTPTDRQPIAASKRMLLTLVGKVENRNMGWNADRTSVSNQWGDGPSQAEYVPLRASLKTDGDRSVWVLDGNGRRKTRLPSSYAAGRLSFETDPATPSLWYEIASP